MPATKQSLNRTPEGQAKCGRILNEVSKYGVRRIGSKGYIHYLKGGRLTLKEALLAKCYQCNGYGRQEGCYSSDCPLYPFYRAALEKGQEPATENLLANIT